MQSLFVAELLQPSDELWLISPWISDIAVIDNADLGFSGLQPDWGARDILLSEILGALTVRGCAVYVELRPDDHNTRFVKRLRAAAPSGASLNLRTSEVLHEKGLLADSFILSGSMNVTYSGVQLLDELVRLDTSASAIAEARLAFRARWGIA